MQLDKYLDNLPPDVILDGMFCVTRNGDKQPYDPIKKYPISVKDTFYPLEDLIVAGVDEYETIGIRTGNGISIIDIDHCVDKNGQISDFAMEIIEYLKSYTEISPSGTGIRILFHTKTPFDIKTHKTKNSKLGLEYYDAVDQETRGGRMARLTGNKIMPYDYREVDTLALLNKYMLRTKTHVNELSDEPINYDWVDVVYMMITHRLDLKNLINRELDIDESSVDLLLCNAIAEYTQNVGEIKMVFEKTKYYRTKGERSSKKRHKEKWDGDYGWNTVMMANPEKIRFTSRPEMDYKVTLEQTIATAVKNGISKEYFYRFAKVDWSTIPLTEQDEVNCLLEIVKMKRQKLNVREEFTEALKNLKR